MTTNQVLVAAKGYLLTHGWRQGSAGSPGGSRCALGAIESGGGKHVLCHGAAEVLATTFGKAEVTEVIGWNDEVGRTFDEVIAAFDRAIIQTAPSSPAGQGGTASRSVGEVSQCECASALLGAEGRGMTIIDGSRVTPGTKKCMCDSDVPRPDGRPRDCEFPCWQRLGVTSQACCPDCAPLTEVDS